MSGPEESRKDRLYDLLPAVYRQRDFEQGEPLRALLRVIAEQVDAVEDDVAQLYDNWFIETCQDWVVPYLGDLIGYRSVAAAGEAGAAPRREVANTIHDRRRKGTLALLEELARDVAGWPARAVEFRELVSFNQHLRHLRPRRGRTADLRRGPDLDRLGGPFERLARTVDVRRVGSRYVSGRPNLPGVGLFVWTLGSYSVTGTPAYCKERSAAHHYTFSVLGNDAPLYVGLRPESDPTHIAGELELPIPITRRALVERKEDYYGPGKSLEIFRVEHKGKKPPQVSLEPVPAGEIVVADLSGWHYQPRKGRVAVDPELGRIVFPPRHVPKHGIRVRYHYGFSADLGGGEYDRPLSQSADAKVYKVGEKETEKDGMRHIHDALHHWREERPRHAVIEITDSRSYVEQIVVRLDKDQTLQIRAARRCRPVIRLLDWQTSEPDALTVHGEEGAAFTLDGLLITGRGMRVEGDLASVCVRHSTLVPGWGLHGDCTPHEPAEPSLELVNVRAEVTIEHSIVGSILINQDEVGTDPVPLRIRDSVVDATSRDLDAVIGPEGLTAHARLTIQRSTVFGALHVHALELGEDSIFEGLIRVARRQIGCLRFSSYIWSPEARLPRRFHCQPDLTDPDHVDAAARERVRPRFRSVRYGSPEYARLSSRCAEEIRRGAEDESEMGVFHDLYLSQRAANLLARLNEYTPAGVDAGLIIADQEAP
jgi:hypothetical protein